MPKQIRLNTWTPLEAPWDVPLSAEDQESTAESAVISGATPTDATVTALLADNSAIYVNALRMANQ